MKKFFIEVALDIIYLFINYLVCYIPCWHIRKVLYKILGMKIGKNARIHMGVKVLIPWRIELGNNSIVNEFCFLDGRGGLKIGDNVSISIYSMMITGSHDKNSENFAYVANSIIIENCVWLGARAIILDGSILKQRTVIGAGSVFKGTTEENGVYVGVPAKKISSRKITSNYDIDYKPFFR